MTINSLKINRSEKGYSTFFYHFSDTCLAGHMDFPMFSEFKIPTPLPETHRGPAVMGRTWSTAGGMSRAGGQFVYPMCLRSAGDGNLHQCNSHHWELRRPLTHQPHGQTQCHCVDLQKAHKSLYTCERRAVWCENWTLRAGRTDGLAERISLGFKCKNLFFSLKNPG